MTRFTEGDFELKKRYCPSVGHNVPIIVYMKEGTEACLCVNDCEKKNECGKYKNIQPGHQDMNGISEVNKV